MHRTMIVAHHLTKPEAGNVEASKEVLQNAQ